jgi:hypothetical protein
VGPKAILDMVVKRIIPSPYWEWNPGHPAHSLVTILIELSQLLNTTVVFFNIKKHFII